MIEPFISSRYLLLDTPRAYPFYDLLLQDSQGPVFDLGVELDSYDGSVYLRTDAVVDMARTLGMATPVEVAELKAENEALKAKINKLPSAQEELKSGIDDLVASFYANLVAERIADDSSIPDNEEPAQDDREPAETERKADGPLIL